MARAVVFDIDGLSIRSVGAYGNVETPTPLLNEFASQAALFEQHYRSATGSNQDRDAILAAFALDDAARVVLLADNATESTFPCEVFQSPDELAGLMERHLEPEAAVVWVRISGAVDEPDSVFPLSLVAALVEQNVLVAVTSANPEPDANPVCVTNEGLMRTPLMVWTGEPSRIQKVTSSTMLDEIMLAPLVTEATGEDAFALIASEERLALREADSMLVVARKFLSETIDVADDVLSDHIDVSGDTMQVFRKPDDVWNVHNVLVEEPSKGVEMLIRLRTTLAAGQGDE